MISLASIMVWENKVGGWRRSRRFAFAPNEKGDLLEYPTKLMEFIEMMRGLGKKHAKSWGLSFADKEVV